MPPAIPLSTLHVSIREASGLPLYMKPYVVARVTTSVHAQNQSYFNAIHGDSCHVTRVIATKPKGKSHRWNETASFSLKPEDNVDILNLAIMDATPSKPGKTVGRVQLKLKHFTPEHMYDSWFTVWPLEKKTVDEECGVAEVNTRNIQIRLKLLYVADNETFQIQRERLLHSQLVEDTQRRSRMKKEMAIQRASDEERWKSLLPGLYNSVIFITVVSGENMFDNVIDYYFGSKVNPYVVIKCGDSTWKSAAAKNGKTPVWNDGTFFNPRSLQDGPCLDVEVWAKDSPLGDTFLGNMRLPVTKLRTGEISELWYELDGFEKRVDPNFDRKNTFNEGYLHPKGDKMQMCLRVLLIEDAVAFKEAFDRMKAMADEAEAKRVAALPKLNVRVVEGQNLHFRIKNVEYVSRAQVTIECGDQRYTCKAVKRDQNPQWVEKLQLAVEGAVQEVVVIVTDLREEGSVEIGRITIPITSMIPKKVYDNWFTLIEPSETNTIDGIVPGRVGHIRGGIDKSLNCLPHGETQCNPNLSQIRLRMQYVDDTVPVSEYNESNQARYTRLEQDKLVQKKLEEVQRERGIRERLERERIAMIEKADARKKNLPAKKATKEKETPMGKDEALEMLNRLRDLELQEGMPPDDCVLGENQAKSFNRFCATGDFAIVSAMLASEKYQVNARLVQAGVTGLHAAAQSGNLDLVNLLLEKGADITTRNLWGQEPIHLAANSDHAHSADIVQVLIDRGADVHTKDQGGHTPLHEACTAGSIRSVQNLISNGADLEAQDGKGCTPLMKAVANLHVDIIHVLGDAKADFYARDNWGATAMHYAFGSGIWSREVIDVMLLYAPSLLELKDRHDMTPLLRAARLGNDEVINYLNQQHGAKLDTQDVTGATALHIACYNNFPKCVRNLLMVGARPNIPDHNGITPVSWASSKSSPHSEKILRVFSEVGFIRENERAVYDATHNMDTLVIWNAEKEHVYPEDRPSNQ